MRRSQAASLRRLASKIEGTPPLYTSFLTVVWAVILGQLVLLVAAFLGAAIAAVPVALGLGVVHDFAPQVPAFSVAQTYLLLVALRLSVGGWRTTVQREAK